MTTTWGNDGVINIAAGSVVEVKSWRTEESVEPLESTKMGDTSKTYKTASGHKAWTASVTCQWDKGDTKQEAMLIGAQVALIGYPEGDASGKRETTGTCEVTGVGLEVDMGAIVQRDFQLLGNGALTHGLKA